MKTFIGLICCVFSLAVCARTATLEMELGETRLVDRTNVSEILLGNGAIATIRPVDKHRALVVSQAVGETEMYFMQSNGSVVTAGLKVMTKGTALGPLALRLIVIEENESKSKVSGVSANIELSGQLKNSVTELSSQGSFAWIPGATQENARVVARPRLLLQPAQPAKLDVGGEIQRAAADGAVEDKEYGLSLMADFLWLDAMTLSLSHEMTLRSPAGEGQFKRQSLSQTIDIGLGQVVELAQFNGLQVTELSRNNGLPFDRNEDTQARVNWRVLGWLESTQEAY